MNVALSDYKEGKLQKSTLYKIPESMTVPFEEIHANGKEVVNLIISCRNLNMEYMQTNIKIPV